MAGKHSSLVEKMNQMAGISPGAANKSVSPIVQQMNEMAGIKTPEPERKYSIGERILQAGHGLAQGAAETIDFLGNAINNKINPGALDPKILQYLENITKTPEDLKKLAYLKELDKRSRDVLHLGEKTGRALSEAYGKELEPTEEDTLGQIIHGGGKLMTPVPGSGYMKAGKMISQGIPAATKALGKVLGREAAMATGASTLMNATPQVFEEGTVPSIVENIGKSIVGASLGNKALSPKSLFQFNAGKKEEIANMAKQFIDMGYPPDSALEEASKLYKYKDAAQARMTQLMGGEEAVANAKQALNEYQPLIPGYTPTTAEVTENLPLAYMERANRGVANVAGVGVPQIEAQGTEAIYDAIKNSMPEQGIGTTQEYLADLGKGLEESRGRLGQFHQERAEHAIGEGLGPRITSEEAGKPIQQFLHGEQEARTAAREAVSKPHYQEMQAIKEGIPVSDSLGTIDHMLETAKGDKEKGLKRIRGMLSRNKIEDVKANPKIAAAQTEYDQMKKVAPDLLGKYYPEGRPEVPMIDINPRPAEVDETIKEIDKLVHGAIARGGKPEAAAYLEVRDKLVSELKETTPSAKKARETFREESPNVNKIGESKQLSNAIKQDEFGKEFKTLASQVPHKIIDDALITPENARRYMGEIKGNKPSVEATEGYINHKFTSEVTDAAGNVKPEKVAQWKKKNPNYETLYPGFGKKIDNASDAQILATSTTKKNERALHEYYNKTVKSVLGSDPQNVIQNTLRGGNPTEKFEELKRLVRHNPAADEGLQRAFLEHFESYIKNHGVDIKNSNALSYAKVEDYLKQYGKSMETVLSPERYETIHNIEKTLRKRQKLESAGNIKGSQTGANAQNVNVFELSKDVAEFATKKLLQEAGVPGGASSFAAAKAVHKFFSRMKAARTDDIIKKASFNPEYAKMLFSTPLKDKASAKRFLEDINKSYVLIPITTAKEKEK
jgi:hypothetical protein